MDNDRSKVASQLHSQPVFTSRSMQRTIIGLAGWLIASYIAAGIGSIASARAGTFYQQLLRPEWAPPSSWFGPVWTVLYFMMAVAAWQVWRKHGFAGARAALTLFVVQLAFNAIWSWLFFAWQLGAASFAEICVLWLLIVGTLVLFWRKDLFASALLVPYLAWVSFAAALNFTLWQNNPQVLS